MCVDVKVFVSLSIPIPIDFASAACFSNGVFMSFRKWDLICIHIVLHVWGKFYSSSSENIKKIESEEENFCKIFLHHTDTHSKRDAVTTST
jgi:hypothetical protein